MKKILKVSLVAMLVASPMVASAGVQYVTDNGMSDTNSGVSASTEIASVSFVQGAYNAAAAGINAEESRAKGVEGELSNLSNGITNTSLVAAINSVAATASNGTSGVEARLETSTPGTNGYDINAKSLKIQDVNVVTTATAASAGVYSNTTSGLTNTTIQGAIDEVEGRLDTAETNIGNLQTATTVAELEQGQSYNTGISHSKTAAQNIVALDTAIGNINSASGSLASDGHYIEKNNTVAENLSALDGQVYENETAIDLLNNSDATVAGSVKNSIKTQAKDADYTNASMENISTISGAIGNLDTRLDTAEGNISNLQAKQVAVRTTWGATTRAASDSIINPTDTLNQ